MTDTIQIPYCWRWPTRALAMAIALVLSWFFWRDPQQGPGVWIARLFGIFCFSVAAIFGTTTIHPSRGHVHRVWKLFGIVPLYSRTFSFGLFREVRWRRRYVESDSNTNHWIELVLNDGRALVLTTFLSYQRDRTCPEANALALQLSQCLHLPFTREPEVI